MFKRILATFIVLSMLLSALPITIAYAASNTVTIKGKIMYSYKDNGNSKSTSSKALSNYHVDLTIWKDSSTGYAGFWTDKNGNFSFTTSAEDLSTVSAQFSVKAEDNSCYVVKTINDIGNMSNIYTFPSQKISTGKNVIDFGKVTISGSGAFNIVKTIRQCYDLLPQNNRPPKIPVVWSTSNGDGTYFDDTNTIASQWYLSINGTSADTDEYDRSVIAHEYGHYVMRDNSQFTFLGGLHSKGETTLDTHLTFSEGWPTFFGQNVLGNENYIDGSSSSLTKYSIESPDSSWGKAAIGNEVYNSAAMWDITDGKGSIFHENWDQVWRHFNDSLVATISMLQNATSDTGITKVPDPKTGAIISAKVNNISSATIKDFYNEYLAKYITPNSQEAYDFWKVFRENGMQFDSEPPKLKISDVETHYTPRNIKFFAVNGTVTDNILVQKIELWLNGKKMRTTNKPYTNFSLVIYEDEYKQGKNNVEVRAYDYGGNTVTDTKLQQNGTISKQFAKSYALNQTLTSLNSSIISEIASSPAIGEGALELNISDGMDIEIVETADRTLTGESISGLHVSDDSADSKDIIDFKVIGNVKDGVLQNIQSFSNQSEDDNIFETILDAFFSIFRPSYSSATASFMVEDETGYVKRVAVTTQGYDSIGAILTNMKIPYDIITDAQVTNYDIISKYDALFLNCNSSALSYASSARNALSNYVNNGGVVYASDFAGEYIQQAFPQKISMSRSGAVQTVLADVTDIGMASSIGKNKINTYFNLGGWTVINTISSDVTVYVQGIVSGGYGNRPLLVCNRQIRPRLSTGTRK